MRGKGRDFEAFGERKCRSIDFFSFFVLVLIQVMILLYIRSMNTLLQVSRIRKRIGQLARQRRAVEQVVLERSVLLKGTLLGVERTCGKSGCKCARGQKHSCWQLTASVEGKSRTRNVPRRYVGKVKELTGNYRRFRQARARWVRLNREMVKWINEMEALRTTADFRDEDRPQER